MKTVFLVSAFMFIACAVFAQDTIPIKKAKVDTVIVEKVRVDTVYLPVKQEIQPQEQQQAPTAEAKNKTKKVYFGGYANFSFGKYTVFGVEPLIGYRLLPKWSVGAKISYEYVKNKNYSPSRDVSNYGVGVFTRLRIGKRLYGHVEYSEMNYKLYDSNGDSNRQWISFLFLGGGISLPVSKSISLNAEILWDVLQDKNSPYSTVEPFINVGIAVGF